MDKFQNNNDNEVGEGNDDKDTSSNLESNNNDENDETSDADIGFLIDKFVEKNPGTHWYQDFSNDYELENIDDIINLDFSE